MSSIHLLFVFVAVANSIVQESRHEQLGSFRLRPSSRDQAGGHESLLQTSSARLSSAAAVPPRKMPTVVHSKKADGNYTEGSPLYKVQEGVEDAAPATVFEAGADREAEAKGEITTGGESAAGGENVGHVAVYGMGVTIVLLSLTFAMASSSNRLVSNFTWQTLDNIISIFLAVLVFQAIDEVVYDAGLIPASYAVLGSFIYALVLLCIAVSLCFVLKGTPSNLAIFVASSAHFVGFGFMHASMLGFANHTSRVWHAVLFFLVVLFLIGSVYALTYQLKKATGLSEDRDLMEKMDDLENDAGAMAASMSWTILMCYLMTSSFQDIIETEAVSRMERFYMLCYAIAMSVVGVALVALVSRLQRSVSKFKKRLGMFCSAFVAMSIAWAWLLWGKWRFHMSVQLESAPMFSRIAFATFASLAAMAVILILANVPGGAWEKDKALALLTVSLVAGWAWEESFDAGLDIIAEGSVHGGTYKVVAAVCLIAIVLPVHVIYFKPILANLPQDLDDIKG